MRVVHISTYDTYGAGIAAIRLHKGLLQKQIDSAFLCLEKTNNELPVSTQYIAASQRRSIIQRFVNKMGFPANTQNSRNAAMTKDLKGQYELFSFPLTDYTIEDHPLIRTADIVHLHWVSNFINYPTFFTKLYKPIVWTLHDMNPLMGGFHYKGDEERNKNEFTNLERKLSTIKLNAVSGIKQLAVVSPSRWLGGCAQKSGMYKHAYFKVIPYGLDLSVFRSHNKTFSRKVLGLPEDKKIILFASEQINNYRKGFDILLEALKIFQLPHNYIIVTIGKTPVYFSTTNDIRHLGVIQDDGLMSITYSAADLFILPSREDNLPNVMLESFACGTPVLSFKTGGMFECIKPGFNGFFADDITPESLAAAIEDYCNGKYVFTRNAIRNFAEANFSLDLQASKYIQLYQTLLNQ